MLTLALVILAAAPRTDGVYLPTKVVPQVLKGQGDEFALGHALVFDAKQVTIGYDMEEDTKQWRWSKEAGLEVRSGDAWSQASWKDGAKGTVTTTLRGEAETFSFVPKTLAQLRALRQKTYDRGVLPSLRGTWTSGDRVLVIAEPSTLDGKPVKLESARCNHSCLDKETSCVQLEKTLLLVQGRTLSEVSIEGACGNHTAGVELVKGGLSFVRK